MSEDLLAAAKNVTTLDHLDALHDEVLARLDQLNNRLDATLAQFGVVRRPAPVPPPHFGARSAQSGEVAAADEATTS